MQSNRWRGEGGTPLNSAVSVAIAAMRENAPDLLAGDFVGGFLIFFTVFEQSYTDKAKYQNGDTEFTGHIFKFQHIFNGTIQKEEEKCIQIIELCVSLLYAIHAETHVIVIFNRPRKVTSSALFQLF